MVVKKVKSKKLEFVLKWVKKVVKNTSIIRQKRTKHSNLRHSYETLNVSVKE